MWMGFEVIKAHPTWRGGRVVDGSGLENQRCESIRGFESHPFRFINTQKVYRHGYNH